MSSEPESCVLVIFGASGDLTSRKLIPALYEMHSDGRLPAGTSVIGISRTPMSDEAWRDSLEPWVKKHAKSFDDATWKSFAQRISYLAGSATEPAMYAEVTTALEASAEKYGSEGRVLFYLSVAPKLYEPIVKQIDAAGLVVEGRRWCSIDREHRSWQRIIVEKPLGRDLATAESLNRSLGAVFEEDAIYRIDHYLGKELVRNVLVLRFANTIFEPLWSHQYIDHVQITAAETVGVGSRASFYDTAGAIRDMIQSHLLQVMALIAMEPPTSYTAHHIRQEKIKIIDAIVPTDSASLHHYAALGQYAGDADEPAYNRKDDIAPDSTTETFAALKIQFDNWRWAGTPFYVRTGKRMAQKRTEVVVQFKPPAANLFRGVGMVAQDYTPVGNRIVIEIAPREGVRLSFQGKVPGAGLNLDNVAMDVDYAEWFNAKAVEAYGPLILDAMRGDQTLFKHRYEVEGAWRAVMPFLGDASATLRKNIHANYAPGSWGPACADELLARDGREWNNDDN
jgi:glucose-6-phosphate 1-dehydrogenase